MYVNESLSQRKHSSSEWTSVHHSPRRFPFLDMSPLYVPLGCFSIHLSSQLLQQQVLSTCPRWQPEAMCFSYATLYEWMQILLYACWCLSFVSGVTDAWHSEEQFLHNADKAQILKSFSKVWGKFVISRNKALFLSFHTLKLMQTVRPFVTLLEYPLITNGNPSNRPNRFLHISDTWNWLRFSLTGTNFLPSHWLQMYTVLAYSSGATAVNCVRC